MASPQVENGYTRIANELLAALTSCNVSSAEFMVVLAVIVRTFGWNKKEDGISLTQFQKLTKMSRPRVVRAIRNLVRYGVLGSNAGDTRLSSTYWIIKDYEKWNIPSNAHVPSNAYVTRPSTVHTGQGGYAGVTHKRHKDNIKTDCKEPKKRVLKSPVALIQEYYYSQYEKAFGKRYVPNWGKDGTIFKDLLKTLPEDQLRVLIDRFLNSKDDFLDKAGYTTGVFMTQVNKLQTVGVVTQEQEILRKAGLLNEPSHKGRHIY